MITSNPITYSCSSSQVSYPINPQSISGIGYIVIFGGFNSDGSISDAVYIFDTYQDGTATAFRTGIFLQHSVLSLGYENNDPICFITGGYNIDGTQNYKIYKVNLYTHQVSQQGTIPVDQWAANCYHLTIGNRDYVISRNSNLCPGAIWLWEIGKSKLIAKLDPNVFDFTRLQACAYNDTSIVILVKSALNETYRLLYLDLLYDQFLDLTCILFPKFANKTLMQRFINSMQSGNIQLSVYGNQIVLTDVLGILASININQLLGPIRDRLAPTYVSGILVPAFYTHIVPHYTNSIDDSYLFENYENVNIAYQIIGSTSVGPLQKGDVNRIRIFAPFMDVFDPLISDPSLSTILLWPYGLICQGCTDNISKRQLAYYLYSEVVSITYDEKEAYDSYIQPFTNLNNTFCDILSYDIQLIYDNNSFSIQNDQMTNTISWDHRCYLQYDGTEDYDNTPTQLVSLIRMPYYQQEFDNGIYYKKQYPDYIVTSVLINSYFYIYGAIEDIIKVGSLNNTWQYILSSDNTTTYLSYVNPFPLQFNIEQKEKIGYICSNRQFDIINPNGNYYIALTTGETSPTSPAWSNSGITLDGNVQWQYIASCLNLNLKIYSASTYFAQYQLALVGNLVYISMTSGTTGQTAPTWSTTGVITDGNVQWQYISTCVQMMSNIVPWQSSTKFNQFTTIYYNGNYYLSVNSGTTGTTCNLSTNALTIDNTITWIYLGNYLTFINGIQPYQQGIQYPQYSLVEVNGSYYISLNNGTSSTSPITWYTKGITYDNEIQWQFLGTYYTLLSNIAQRLGDNSPFCKRESILNDRTQKFISNVPELPQFTNISDLQNFLTTLNPANVQTILQTTDYTVLMYDLLYNISQFYPNSNFLYNVNLNSLYQPVLDQFLPIYSRPLLDSYSIFINDPVGDWIALTNFTDILPIKQVFDDVKIFEKISNIANITFNEQQEPTDSVNIEYEVFSNELIQIPDGQTQFLTSSLTTDKVLVTDKEITTQQNQFYEKVKLVDSSSQALGYSTKLTTNFSITDQIFFIDREVVLRDSIVLKDPIVVNYPLYFKDNNLEFLDYNNAKLTNAILDHLILSDYDNLGQINQTLDTTYQITDLETINYSESSSIDNIEFVDNTSSGYGLYDIETLSDTSNISQIDSFFTDTYALNDYSKTSLKDNLLVDNQNVIDYLVIVQTTNKTDNIIVYDSIQTS
jgi:hypothetical protein